MKNEEEKVRERENSILAQRSVWFASFVPYEFLLCRNKNASQTLLALQVFDSFPTNFLACFLQKGAAFCGRQTGLAGEF